MWNWFQKNETKINKPRPIFPRMLTAGGGGSTSEIKLGTLITPGIDPTDPVDPSGIGSMSVWNAQVTPPVQTAETLVVVWDWMRAQHGGGATLATDAEVAAIKFLDAVAASQVWQATTHYDLGEKVSHARISDSVEYNWTHNAERELTRATWDATEESFWTIGDQVSETELWRLMWWVPSA